MLILPTGDKQILLNVGLKLIVKLNFVGVRFVFFYLIKELHTKAQHLETATFLSALRALRPLRSPNIVGLPFPGPPLKQRNLCCLFHNMADLVIWSPIGLKKYCIHDKLVKLRRFASRVRFGSKKFWSN